VDAGKAVPAGSGSGFYNLLIGKEESGLDTYTPRIFPRNAYLAPIKYSPEFAGGYEEARLCDYSRAGFGIEPNRLLEPGRHCYILTNNYAPGTYGPEAYRAYQVRIQWCRENDEGGGFPFKAGAQILSMHHELCKSPECQARMHCDLCGRPTQIEKLRSWEGVAALCRPCHDHLSRIRDAGLKQNILRFIAENVDDPQRVPTMDKPVATQAANRATGLK
jgi:hypothetical protein